MSFCKPSSFFCFFAPLLSQSSYKQILPTHCTPQMCRSHGKGTLLLHPTSKALNPLGICTEFLCHSHCGSTAWPGSILCPSTFCRQALSNQTVKYSYFCKVLLSLLTNATLYLGCYLQNTRCFMEKPRFGQWSKPKQAATRPPLSDVILRKAQLQLPTPIAMKIYESIYF